MNKEKKKKKLKLKKNIKVILCVLFLLILVGSFGYKRYQEYLYTKTSDYALLELGYTESELEIFNKKLSDETKWHIINDIGYSEFLYNFVNETYFLEKNIDLYLDQTVTKEEDFWHYKKASEYDYETLVAKVNTRVINDAYTNTIATDMSKGLAILVNKYHYLDENYAPDDLVNIPWKYRFGGANDIIQIRSEVYDAFLNMWQAANKEGYYLLIDSGFRTGSYQKTIYDEYANKSGITYADSIAARSGFSEHQTGLCIDLYSKENSSASTFKDSEVFKWLSENSYKYGFIIRYPEGKKSLTGYNFESWHYRYLGVDLATKVYESGLTYDEYYEFYLDD